MLQQLTDDYEFDESKGKLTERDVSANATGTVSGMLFPLYISYIRSTLLFCLRFILQGCWLPFISLLCARWGSVQHGREEGKVDFCQVWSVTIRIIFIYIISIYLLIYLYICQLWGIRSRGGWRPEQNTTLPLLIWQGTNLLIITRSTEINSAPVILGQ